jgi:hypothetical protein
MPGCHVCSPLLEGAGPMSRPDWSVVVRAERSGGDERAGAGADLDLIAPSSRLGAMRPTALLAGPLRASRPRADPGTHQPGPGSQASHR